MLLHDSSGAQGEWLDLVCWCAEGTNRTEFPCGFSSTAAVCRTCRTLTLMVLPHLPAIVQLLRVRQVSSTSPSPQLHRARILPLGLHRAPSPHLPREPSPQLHRRLGPAPSLSCPGPGPQSLSHGPLPTFYPGD